MEIKLVQILFQVVNFGVVLGALTVLLYKPILKMLDERAKKVEEADKAAQETLREKEEIDALKKKSKVQADRDAAKLLEKAREQAAELKKELAKKAKDELHQEHEKALSVWKQEKSSMMSEMQKEFASAVFAVTEKLIGQSVDKKAHTKLIDQGIKELAKIV